MIKKLIFINRIFRIVCVFLIVSTSNCRSQHTLNHLKEDVFEFSKDASLKNAAWGISVIDIEAGTELVGYNSSMSLIPASTMKVVTTATVLSLLGPEFRFTTFLEISGQIDANGILNGNLFIRGGGDTLC